MSLVLLGGGRKVACLVGGDMILDIDLVEETDRCKNGSPCWMCYRL